MRYGFILSLLFYALAAHSQDRISVHDPVMIRQDGVYYIFCTGRGISVFTSTDRINWEKEKPVFTTPPDWAPKAVPGFKDHIWAPDISYRNGLYYLYYAVSAFGKNTSVIGLATNKTLNPASPDFHWEDRGAVIQSVPVRDNWNAIDPNLVLDSAGTPWLAFGSFWSGIKLVKLNPQGTAPAEPQEWHALAERAHERSKPDSLPGNSAVEAPFIFHKNGYYYLFVSWDFCCRAEKSNYKLMVGRSKMVTGPYLDKAGHDMRNNGGSLLLAGDKDWYAVGHNATVSFDGHDYLIFHAYDAHDGGKPKLRIEELHWDAEGWPVIFSDTHQG